MRIALKFVATIRFYEFKLLVVVQFILHVSLVNNKKLWRLPIKYSWSCIHNAKTAGVLKGKSPKKRRCEDMQLFLWCIHINKCLLNKNCVLLSVWS